MKRRAKMTFKQKLNILKDRGAAKEMAGRGIYAFGLGTSNRKMMLMGKTWEDAIAFCDSYGWFQKFERKMEEKKAKEKES